MVNPSFLFGFLLGAPIGFSSNFETFSPAFFEQVKEFIAEFKADRDFWMKAECRILCDTKSMLVLQYNDAEFCDIKVLVFSLKSNQSGMHIYPKIEEAGDYTVDGSILSASQIKEYGINVGIDKRFDMKMVTLKKC